MFEMRLPDEILTVISRLHERGFDGYVVGGCVRDAMRGIEPNDFDVATDALPHDILEVFSDCKTIDVGAKHGTVIVVVNGKNIEITTFRIDGEYRDNRHPSEVRFTKELLEDLSRRDFTVNAMAFNPDKGLADFFDGRRHITEKTIKCVGEPDVRFSEDGLRILRALRFSSTLGFEIEDETAAAIHRNRFLLNNISAERIYAEFVKLICGVGAGNVLIDFYDVVSVFVPEFEAVAIKGLLEHTVKTVENVTPEKTLRLAAFLHCVGEGHGGEESAEICDAVMRRLKTDNTARKSVSELVLYCGEDMRADEAYIRRLISKTSTETAEALVKLKYSCLLAQPDHGGAELQKTQKAGELIDMFIRNGASVSLKNLAVNGADLMTAGIEEGKALGCILQRLYDAVLDGRLENDKETLLAEAMKLSENHIP